MSGGPFKDLLDTPSFFFAEWTSFDQEYLIPDMASVLFVVGLHLCPLPDILLVDGVEDQTIDHHDHGLIHLVARNNAR